MAKITQREAESLERILQLVEKSVQQGIAGGEDEDRKIATGIILRDIGILKKIYKKAGKVPVILLPLKRGFDAS